jgi:ATP-binding protein involved in chromosome partitioning
VTTGAVIAVTSGKGGVGKSTVSLNLALALAERGGRVGLLDADFYGPDIPLMVNLKRDEPLQRWLLGRTLSRGAMRLEPVERFGLKIMSVGFLIGEAQALTMPAQLLHGALRQLLTDVEWGELDQLLIDLPPGTADLQQQLVDSARISGALVVVGPQDVAHLDARKVVDMLQGSDVPILGGVENMSELVCPHCGERIAVFPSAREERTIWSLGIARLASIPLDPAVAAGGDRGSPIFTSQPEGVQADVYRALAAAVLRELDARRPAA